MTRLPALLCTLAATAALGYASDKEDTLVVTVTLEPQKMHEECVKMEAGQKRRYNWRSSAPVDFNIHYHRGTDVFYPVKRDGMRGDGGTFVAKSSADYCWMWTARDRSAKVEGQIR